MIAPSKWRSADWRSILNTPALYAVLGQCYEAAGDPQKARATWQEGLRLFPEDGSLRELLNLVGAFLMAGAKDVVASLWPADDRFMATLMKKFYGHLAEGLDDAAALKRAELDILRQYGDQTAPDYWAAFEVIGQGGGKITFRNGADYAAFTK